jgi:hypothetical protein
VTVKRTLFTILVATLVVAAGVGGSLAAGDTGDSAASDDPAAIANPAEEDPAADPAAPETVTEEVDPNLCPPPGGDVCIQPMPVDPGGGGGIPVDRAAIVNYARTYVGDLVNTSSSRGYNLGPPTNYSVFRNDCQNFVSQALRAGGWPMLPQFNGDPLDNSQWFYRNGNYYNRTWAAVSYFMKFAQTSGWGTFVRYWSNVRPGDVVSVDWNGALPGNLLHSMIVTDVVGTPSQPGFDVKFTYHTNNRLDKSRNALIAAQQERGWTPTWWAFHLYDAVG